MMGRTHLLVGLASLWLLEPVPGVLTSDSIGPLVLGAALGSLLPDLDATQSKLRSVSIARIQPFVPLSWLAHRAFGHRGKLHSPGAWLLLGLVCLSLGLILTRQYLFLAPNSLAQPLSPLFTGLGSYGPFVLLGIWLGYGSHLLADAATASGIPGWPFTSKRLHLLPQGFRFVTGSLAEEMLLPLLALLVLVLLLTHLP